MSLKPLLPIGLLFISFLVICNSATAQYKSFKISIKGDTLNIVDKDGLKQGRWVVHVDPLRGEPGYEEEGVFINNKKSGPWRKYTLAGDFIALENFKDGDKDGKCQYYNAFGNLLREENWRAYDASAPYDTIAIYGKDNNEIIGFKVVKAETYSVKNGDWTYYDPTTGRILKTETYDRGHLVTKEAPTQFVSDEPMKKIKPKEVLEYEKKNSGKKKVHVRDGQTSN